MMNALFIRHFDESKRETVLAAVEAVVYKARDHVKVQVEYTLATMPLVILPDRNAVRRRDLFYRPSHRRHRLHQRTAQVSFDAVNIAHMRHRDHYYMSAILRALVQAREYGRCAVLVGDDTGREVAFDDAAEDALFGCGGGMGRCHIMCAFRWWKMYPYYS